MTILEILPTYLLECQSMMGGDHYQASIPQTTVRLNIRGSSDEINYLRGIDICSIVASSFYKDGLHMMSGAFPNISILETSVIMEGYDVVSKFN